MSHKALIILTFCSLCLVATSFNVLQVAQVAKIFPTKVIKEIPSKIKSKYLEMDENDDRLTTSFTFPEAYKTTVFKDREKKVSIA